MPPAEKSLRITFLTYRPGLSGGARVIADYAQHLLRRGHDVRVFAQPDRPTGALAGLKSRLSGKPAKPFCSSPFFEPLGERFIRLPRRGAPRASDLPDADILIANFWVTAAWVAAMPASKGAKVYFMQDYGAAGQPLDKVHKTWKLGLKTITISRYLQSEIERVAGVKAALAPCGVDAGFFLDHQRKARAGAPTVGFVFSNNAMKGSSVCIEAIGIARKTIPDLRAVAFGPKPPEDPAAMPPYVSFKPNVSEAEARALYAGCDAWLFGTIREGFGLPILEAMAAGTPMIAARSAAAPDILAHGGGVLVPVGDAPAMAQAIVDICRLPVQEWLALSKRAVATARLYSLDEARARFEAALIALVEGRFDALIKAA